MTNHLFHIVAPGETLRGIARQYDVSVRQIKALNRLTSSQLFLDQRLLIRVNEAEAVGTESAFKARSLLSNAPQIHVVKAGETLFRIAKLYNISVDQLRRDNQLRNDTISIGMSLRIGQKPVLNENIPANQVRWYTVVKGDTLFKIARQHQMDVAALKALNNLKSETLSIGMKLRVGVQAGGQVFPPPPPPPTPPVVRPNPTPAPDPRPNPTPSPTGVPDLISQRQDPQFNLFLEMRLLSGEVRTFRLLRREPGYSFVGQSRQLPSMAEINRIGLSAQVFNALQFCKRVEGHYDAINTYDAGIFSYGFIQFAAKFSLHKLLQSMKDNAPSAFQQTFQRAGISVHQDQISVQGAPTNLDQVQLWDYLRQQQRLFVPFIQAGYVPELILEQYRVANALYGVPSLGANLNLVLAGGVRQRLTVGQLLRDLETQALAIAIGVNLGINTMSVVLSEAFSDLAQRRGISDANVLASLPWRDFCVQLIDFETVPRPNQTFRKSVLTIERARKVLESGVPRVMV